MNNSFMTNSQINNGYLDNQSQIYSKQKFFINQEVWICKSNKNKYKKGVIVSKVGQKYEVEVTGQKQKKITVTEKELGSYYKGKEEEDLFYLTEMNYMNMGEHICNRFLDKDYSSYAYVHLVSLQPQYKVKGRRSPATLVYN